MEKQSMRLPVELIPDEEQGGFTATIPDIPAYGEGDTEDAAIEDLNEALRLSIEVRGIDRLLSLVRPGAHTRDVELRDIIGGDAP
jgi:predicted RNase H-like HicB family nuclease